jgi:hypothetical protein
MVRKKMTVGCVASKFSLSAKINELALCAISKPISQVARDCSDSAHPPPMSGSHSPSVRSIVSSSINTFCFSSSFSMSSASGDLGSDDAASVASGSAIIRTALRPLLELGNVPGAKPV